MCQPSHSFSCLFVFVRLQKQTGLRGRSFFFRPASAMTSQVPPGYPSPLLPRLGIKTRKEGSRTGTKAGLSQPEASVRNPSRGQSRHPQESLICLAGRGVHQGGGPLPAAAIPGPAKVPDVPGDDKEVRADVAGEGSGPGVVVEGIAGQNRRLRATDCWLP